MERYKANVLYKPVTSRPQHSGCINKVVYQSGCSDKEMTAWPNFLGKFHILLPGSQNMIKHTVTKLESFRIYSIAIKLCL